VSCVRSFMSALAMQLFVALYRGLFCIHTKTIVKVGQTIASPKLK
jgi:hypothetical protein